MTSDEGTDDGLAPFRWVHVGLREFLAWVTVIALVVGFSVTLLRLRSAEQELAVLWLETGHLSSSSPGQIAAVRVPSDQSLTYRVRVRVPGDSRYRVAYSSLWPGQAAAPQWYAAVAVPEGESLVTVRIGRDSRDDSWKITTLVRSDKGTQRVATVLPDQHVEVFRGAHDVISAGTGRQTVVAGADESIRILDERWLVGEASLLLYGNKPPEQDQIGVFAEVQPDVGSL